MDENVKRRLADIEELTASKFDMDVLLNDTKAALDLFRKQLPESLSSANCREYENYAECDFVQPSAELCYYVIKLEAYATEDNIHTLNSWIYFKVGGNVMRAVHRFVSYDEMLAWLDSPECAEETAEIFVDMIATFLERD